MTSEKPTPQQIESHQFDLDSVNREFHQAFEDAWQKVKEGKAKITYRFKDGIQDGDHLEHVTFTGLDGTIIYDEDFIIEKDTLKRVDSEDN